MNPDSSAVCPDASEPEIWRHLRGIRRVVINACHGGFDLSHEAILRYHELSGRTIYWQVTEPSSSWSPKIYYLDQECTKGNHWDHRDIARDDPVLVRVVQEMGDAAGTDFAQLKIVEIPESVDWTIMDYDGLEWVAERHRTWS